MIKTFNFYITFTSIFKSNLQDDTILQRKGEGQQPLILPFHGTSIRLRSLSILTGYVCHLACQLLIVSSLSLAWPSPLEAMEKEDFLPSSARAREEEVKKRRRAAEDKETFPLAKRPAIEASAPEASSSSSTQAREEEVKKRRRANEDKETFPPAKWLTLEASDPEEPPNPLKTITKIDVSAHPLTQAFWKDREPSDRLKKIRKDIEDITEKFINSSKDPISDLMKINSGRYRDILTCSQCDTRASSSLIDAHLSHFKGAWDQKIINNIGCTNTSVTILSRGPTNVIAIKTFKDTEETPQNIREGLKELLYSLLAYRMNPSPSDLKMVRIYEAIICPENSLHLIMEGANKGDIHYFLATDLAENVVKACAQYLAKFHIGNYKKNKRLIKGKEYLSHKAEAYHKISYDPLKEENELSLRIEKQQLHLETVTARNIIRLLSEKDQQQFAGLVERNRERFKRNCEKIFKYLKGSGTVGNPGFYFLTRTHGDAHGNNFFYNDEKDLTNSEGIIGADSFYRISMIDYASIIRTYGGIGDPAEDVGRFLGSLWDWAARPGNQAHSDYDRINGLQDKFLQAYHQIIRDERVLPSEQQDEFYTIFRENTTFYKFRFYKAIFNSKKDKETKVRLLKSWIQENANIGISPTRYVLKVPPQNRPWQPVTERPLYWLPNHLEGFIESHRESGESYLTSLWRQFNGGVRTATISSTIAGMGGVGKTSLALAYAYEALENKGYHLIYWLLSETESSLLKGYRDLLERINVVCKDEVDSRLIELIKENLPRFGKCLLIYDNVPDPKFLEGKVPGASHIDILMTSRYNQGWEGNLVDLAIFRPEDSVKYLLQTIGLKDTQANQAKVGELAEELGHLPLALSHAAHYLKLVRREEAAGDIIDKYIKKFRKTPIDHFEKRQHPFESDKLAITHEHLIGRTFQMSREKLSELAQRLMIHCAYLDPDMIAEEIFLRGLQGSNQEEIQEAFEQLSAYSLIKKRENNAIFHMHRLLQLVILNEQKRNVKHANNLASLKRIFGRTSLREESTFIKIKNHSDDWLNWHERLSRYRINLERVINHCKDLKIDESILSSYQRIYDRINQRYTSFREEIFKGKNELPENSPEEDNAISLLKKELVEGGLTLDNEQCRIIFRLIPQNSQQSDRLRIARVLSQMNLSQYQGFVESFKPLMTPDMEGDERATIIEALAKINLDQRQGFIDNAKQLFTPDMEGDERASIIIALAKVEADQRQGFIDSAKQLLTPDMGRDARASIIKALAKIEADQLYDFIGNAKQLLARGMREYQRASIIIALAKIEADQRQGFIDSAKQLLTPDMRGDDQASIIKALAKIEADQRQSVIDSAKQLLTPDMGRDARASIIIALAKVEADQRQGFIDSAKQLLAPDMRGDAQATIIEALAEIDADQRQGVIDSAKQLLSPDMKGNEQASIITALAKVKADQRQGVIESTKQLLTPDMKGNEQASIITALAKVKADQRQGVIESTKQLLTPEMRGNEQASIIIALAKVKADQRQGVIESTKQLLSPEMRGNERATIITALATIDADQWRGVVDSAKQLMTPEMGGDERASIILKACKEIEATSRQRVAQVLKQPVAPDGRGSGEDSVAQTQFVIDLGSSGVQLGGFKVNREERIVEEQFFNKKERILLQAAIHNRMLPDDVQKQTVSALKNLLSEAGINSVQTKVVGFATAWARAADNSNQLIDAIKSETNITITIIDQHIEGEIGFNATLAALRSLMVDRQSFLYQTENGKEIRLKMTGHNPDNSLIPQTIMSWDIGGGSMQLAKQTHDNRIEVIGSTDASTTFANAVIELKRDLSEEEESLSQGTPPDTPNPLSGAQMKAVINLAREKAARFIDPSFLDGLKSKTREVFGLGLMHKSNREYINKLLGLEREHFYRKSDLEKAAGLLTDKGDREIAHALGIKESDVRNRYTSMLLVLGFMHHLGIEQINTIDVTGITGVFFTDKLYHSGT